MLLPLTIVAFLSSQIIARDHDYCYADDDNPYLYMATKTAYQFVHGGKTRYQTIPNCNPVQIWMLARHGTRYPKKSTITKLHTLPKLRDQIIYNHEIRGFGNLCDKDLKNLQSWNSIQNLTEDMAQYLTVQGEEDLKLLARRLQTNFPELLQPSAANITSTNYKFRSTDSQRTKASLTSFMHGLFGSSNAVTPEHTPANDTLLKAYKVCDSYQETLNDPSVFEESSKFGNGIEIENLLHNVSRRLGFRYNITTTSVGLMYDMCRYEKAWNVTKVSPWCAVFTVDELQILEYQEDLYYYYYTGPSREINARVGCPPLQDMFQHFQKLEGSEYSHQPKGIFYFTHSGSLQTTMTALGIAKDKVPLTASNYKEMSKRLWRTSEIGSFATNIVAVFYNTNPIIELHPVATI
ncbi:multiple inositol polyphosphate phosphatase 1 isoform X3 [Cephus cinctus]|uniref:Multiple inositol polyphosphate phosphatase 1 n=1 Tax=Cephus cinctus TaxID=211228 RepID=A0AAJ7W735_CEPCN|nr:multiple inositol polyphosphate phosphatase 1 isoform X3 [Cephus cinctus]